MIAKELSHIILSKIKRNYPAIIAVGGAADLGKSFLSQRLCESIKQKGVSCNHLTLDSFMMDRQQRLEKNISGYHFEAYDANGIIDTLVKFNNQEAIVFYPYIHQTGTKSESLHHLSPSKVLILDGLHAMNKHFSPFIQFSIFLYTDDSQLIAIRTAADLVKRKYSTAFSNQISPIEFQRYKDHVEPYKKKADLRLFLRKKWEYNIDLE